MEKSLLQDTTADLVGARTAELRCTASSCVCMCVRVRVRAAARGPLAALLLPARPPADRLQPPFSHVQVTFLHGLHLVDTPRALDEAHRLLKPHGKLVAAWNDRCGPRAAGARLLFPCSIFLCERDEPLAQLALPQPTHLFSLDGAACLIMPWRRSQESDRPLYLPPGGSL